MRVPTLAPRRMTVAGSLIVPGPKMIARKNAAFSATSAGATITCGVRARSASLNASYCGRFVVNAVFTSSYSAIAAERYRVRSAAGTIR